MRRTNRVRGEDGAAAVEFALISTVLFMLLFGIIEFGQAFSQYQAFQGAAREGARVAAVRQDPGAVRARVIEAANPFTLDEVGGTGVLDVDIADSELTTCDSTTIGNPVTVQWRQRFDIQLPMVPPIDGAVWIKAVFKCE